MSLNLNVSGYDLASPNRAKQCASWAVLHLSDAVWHELFGDPFVTKASTFAANANALHCWDLSTGFSKPRADSGAGIGKSVEWHLT